MKERKNFGLVFFDVIDASGDMESPVFMLPTLRSLTAIRPIYLNKGADVDSISAWCDTDTEGFI